MFLWVIFTIKDFETISSFFDYHRNILIEERNGKSSEQQKFYNNDGANILWVNSSLELTFRDIFLNDT